MDPNEIYALKALEDSDLMVIKVRIQEYIQLRQAGGYFINLPLIFIYLSKNLGLDKNLQVRKSLQANNNLQVSRSLRLNKSLQVNKNL